MAGTIQFSLSQQFDRYGQPLAGGSLYLIQAGTTSTPQNGYQDSGLTIALPNPIPLDAAGRLPQFFLADGLIKVRLVDSDGVQQLVADGVQVIGPSSGGGGGGGSVDPTTIFQTGDVIWLDQSGSRTGWVRDNGRTLGSASSGATERANSDCEALFGFLWQKYSDTICPVSGGRGSSSSDDWGANKTIQLPDKRLYVPGGLAGMGNTSLALSSAVPIITGDANTAGSRVGSVDHTLTAAQLAQHTHSGTTGSMNRNASHTHGAYIPSVGRRNVSLADSAALVQVAAENEPVTVNPTNTDHEHAFTTDTGAGVSGSAHNNMSLTVLGTFFRKL